MDEAKQHTVMAPGRLLVTRAEKGQFFTEELGTYEDWLKARLVELRADLEAQARRGPLDELSGDILRDLRRAEPQRCAPGTHGMRFPVDACVRCGMTGFELACTGEPPPPMAPSPPAPHNPLAGAPGDFTLHFRHPPTAHADRAVASAFRRRT